MDNFCGAPVKTDFYNGIQIDLGYLLSESNSADGQQTLLENKFAVEDFNSALKDSLEFWIKDGKRCVWITIPGELSHLIPVFIKYKFEFHHAKSNFVMLIKWISQTEEMAAPKYAHSMIGVGGLVINSLTKKVLLIQEKNAHVRMWKFPGGYAEPEEDLHITAIREVFEETGLECKFHSLITFRQRHKAAFGCSDMYFVALLEPVEPEATIKKCQVEIEACRWFDFDEALQNLCGFNKFVFERFLEQYSSSLSTNSTETKCNAINSEMINCQYGKYKFDERVFSVGQIKPFENSK